MKTEATKTSIIRNHLSPSVSLAECVLAYHEETDPIRRKGLWEIIMRTACHVQNSVDTILEVVVEMENEETE